MRQQIVHTPLEAAAGSDEEDETLSEEGTEDAANPMPRVSNRRAFMAVVGLLLVVSGVIAGMVFEKWSLLKCVYVVMQVVTTIGYGDITVTSSHMKVFMAIWCCLLLTFGGALMNEFIENNMRKHLSKRAEYLRSVLVQSAAVTDISSKLVTDKRVKSHCGHYTTFVVASIFLALNVLFGTLFFRLSEVCVGPDEHSLRVGVNETCAGVGGVEKGYAEAFYMSVITCTTVGFGDHVPRTDLGRLVAIFWMPLAVGSATYFIGAVSKSLERLDGEALWESFDATKLAKDDFEELDTFGTGYVTRAEFQGYLLVKSGLIPRDVLQALDKKYDEIDPDGTNKVTWDMVARLATKQSL